METTFTVGVAEVDITPSTGRPMDGYMARTSPSSAVHDPLMAQVLLVSHGAQKAALVTLDLLAVTHAFAGPLRDAIAALLGATPAAVLVAASHTHAGPAGAQDWFPLGANVVLDRPMVESMHERIVAAARQALANMQPATLRSAAGPIQWIGGDRNEPDQPVDTQVTALAFDNADGQPKAILFHYACHPTVLSAANTAYSADFPGAARRRLKRLFPHAVALYVNGAAGNISTRFLRREQSFDEVERLGARLGDHVSDLLSDAQPAPVSSGVASSTASLPLRSPADNARTLDAAGNARLETVRAEGLAIEADLRRAFAGRSSINARLGGLRVGPWSLLSVPGEAFSDLAVSLRAANRQALVAGYANDYLGYFPTQRAIDGGTYEALSSPYDARAHERLLQALLELDQRLGPSAERGA